MFCDGITCGKGTPLVKGDGSLGFGAGIESMLDIESITGVAGNVEVSEPYPTHLYWYCLYWMCWLG